MQSDQLFFVNSRLPNLTKRAKFTDSLKKIAFILREEPNLRVFENSHGP